MKKAVEYVAACSSRYQNDGGSVSNGEVRPISFFGWERGGLLNSQHSDQFEIRQSTACGGIPACGYVTSSSGPRKPNLTGKSLPAMGGKWRGVGGLLR